MLIQRKFLRIIVLVIIYIMVSAQQTFAVREIFYQVLYESPGNLDGATGNIGGGQWGASGTNACTGGQSARNPGNTVGVEQLNKQVFNASAGPGPAGKGNDTFGWQVIYVNLTAAAGRGNALEAGEFLDIALQVNNTRALIANTTSSTCTNFHYNATQNASNAGNFSLHYRHFSGTNNEDGIVDNVNVSGVPARFSWNSTTITILVNAGTGPKSSELRLNASGNHTVVDLIEDIFSNGTEITSDNNTSISINGSTWPNGFPDGISGAVWEQFYNTMFTCNATAATPEGIYQTTYNVSSQQNLTGDQSLTVKCDVRQPPPNVTGFTAFQVKQIDGQQNQSNKILNSSETNITVDVRTSITGNQTADVVAEIFSYNGSFYGNFTMTNNTSLGLPNPTGNPNLYNLTRRFDVSASKNEPFGNYTVRIHANDTNGWINSSEKGTFAVYINSTFLSHEIGIDGDFPNNKEWHNVTGIFDNQVDTLSKKKNQFFRPNTTLTELGTVDFPELAFDWQYNNTNTSTNISIARQNYTFRVYKNPMNEVVLHTTLNGSIEGAIPLGAFGVDIFNYSKSEWYTWIDLSGITQDIKTFSTKITRAEGLISNDGNITVHYNATLSGLRIDVYDLYAEAIGRNYTFEGVTNPSLSHNATTFSAGLSGCPAKYCEGTELSTASYRKLELDDNVYFPDARGGPSTSGGLNYHFFINENTSRISRVYAFIKGNASSDITWSVYNMTQGPGGAWEEIGTLTTGLEQSNLAIFDAPWHVIDNATGDGNKRGIHFRVQVTGGGAGATTYTVDYVTVQLNLSEEPAYDIKNVSIANNLSNISFRMDMKGNLIEEDPTRYYRVWMGNSLTGTGESVATNNNENLPFGASQTGSLIEYIMNGSCTTYNISGGSFIPIGSCISGHGGGRLELSTTLNELGLFNNSPINVSFETGDSVDRLDLGPDYGSFINYTVFKGKELGLICTIDHNLTDPVGTFAFGIGGNLNLPPYSVSDERDVRFTNDGSTGGDVDAQGTNYDGPDGPGSLGVNNTSVANVSQQVYLPLTPNLQRIYTGLSGGGSFIDVAHKANVPIAQKEGFYNQNITYLIAC